MDTKISYRKTREFGEVFAASFAYARLNFKTLFGSLMLFAGPFLLAGSLFTSYFLDTGTVTQAASKGLPYMIWSLGGFYLSVFAALFVGVTVYTVVLNKHIIANEALLPDETLSIGGVVKNFFGDYWRVVANLIAFTVVFALAVVLLVLMFSGMAGLLTMVSGSQILLGILIVLLFLAGTVILLPIFSFVPLAAIFVCQRDKINIFSAIGKVLGYMKQNFWKTWVLSFLAFLTYMFLSMIVQLPAIIMTMVNTFSRLQTQDGYTMMDSSKSLTLIVVTAICALLAYGVMALYYLMNIFHFTNLEEKKEGTHLIDNINQIV